MKIKNLLILLGVCLFFSCKQINTPETNEENGLKLDISKFEAWGDCSYDKNTGLYITNKPTECIGLWVNGQTKDWEKYNCIRVKYETQDYGFFLVQQFADDMDKKDFYYDEYYCPSNMNEFIIPLNKEHLSSITGIMIKGIWENNVHVTIKELTLLEKDNPGPSKTYKETGEKVLDTGSVKKIDSSIDAWDYVPDMGVGFQYAVCGGFNYGIDFGIDASYAWGYPKETKETIHAIAQKGFKTLRLQVAGSFHVINEDFTMDPAFLKQLKKIVDWAIDEGMYVIITEGCCSYYYPDECFYQNFPYKYDKIRHEWCVEHLFGAGYCINNSFADRSEKYLKAFWSQICEAFNNSYDEHLVFEFMNEPVDLTDHGWQTVKECPVCQDDVQILNQLNQTVLHTIRASGGNNANRFLMVPTLGQDPLAVDFPGFKLPEDSAKNKLIVSAHNYPMGNQPDSPKIYSQALGNEVIKKPFEKVDEVFFSKKIPFAVTETGCSKWVDLVERMACMKDFMTEVTKEGRSCCVTILENPAHNKGDNFCYLKKDTNTWYDDAYVDLLIKMADKKDISSESEYLEENAKDYGSIIEKNILKSSVNLGYWETISFGADLFARKVPESFTLEISYTIPAVFNEKSLWSSLELRYYGFNWVPHYYHSKKTVITGAEYYEDLVNNFSNLSIKPNNPSSSGTITIGFTKEMSDILQCYGIVFGGENIILNSIVIRE